MEVGNCSLNDEEGRPTDMSQEEVSLSSCDTIYIKSCILVIARQLSCVKYRPVCVEEGRLISA